MSDAKQGGEGSRGQQEPLTFETAYIYHGMDFETLFDEMGDPEYETFFYNIVKAFDGLSEDNLDERVRALADGAQKLHPEYPGRIKQQGTPLRYPLFDFWHFYTLLVRCVPHRHIAHRLAVEVVKILEKLGQSENPQWKDLPDLGMVIREAWLDPTDEDLIGGDEKFTSDQWLNFQSWLARLLGKGSKLGLNFVVWSLEHGLEQDMHELEENVKRAREERKELIEDTRQEKLEWKMEKEQQWKLENGFGENPGDKDDTDGQEGLHHDSAGESRTKEDRSKEPGDVADEQIRDSPDDEGQRAKCLCVEATTRVAVAAEWFIHASPAILKETLLWSTRGPFDDSDERVFRPGPLFAGSFGFSLERWGFWKRRLGESRDAIVDEKVNRSINEALEKMIAAEVTTASCL